MKTVVVKSRVPRQVCGQGAHQGSAPGPRPLPRPPPVKPRPQGLTRAMRLLIVAVGQRVPDGRKPPTTTTKRFPHELRVELKAVKTEPRGSKTLETLYAAERERIEAAIPRAPAWWRWTSVAPA